MIVFTSARVCWSAICFLLDYWAAGVGVRFVTGESCPAVSPVSSTLRVADRRRHAAGRFGVVCAGNAVAQQQGADAGTSKVSPAAASHIMGDHADGHGRSPSSARGEAALSIGRRLMAIYNPTSGGGHFRRDVPLIVESLRASGFSVEEAPTERVGHATELAARAVVSGIDVVCAIGGDGTVNE